MVLRDFVAQKMKENRLGMVYYPLIYMAIKDYLEGRWSRGRLIEDLLYFGLDNFVVISFVDGLNKRDIKIETTTYGGV